MLRADCDTAAVERHGAVWLLPRGRGGVLPAWEGSGGMQRRATLSSRTTPRRHAAHGPRRGSTHPVKLAQDHLNLSRCKRDSNFAPSPPLWNSTSVPLPEAAGAHL